MKLLIIMRGQQRKQQLPNIYSKYFRVNENKLQEYEKIKPDCILTSIRI